MKLLVTILLLTPFFCFSQAGSLDKTFGDKGKAYAPANTFSYKGAIQPDDKILAGGESVKGYTLLRYLPDGTVDTSFGKKGVAVIEELHFPTCMQVLENGNIMTGGNDFGKLIAAQFKQDGSLDSSFGQNGYVVYLLGGTVYINSLQVQTDGKIILAGRITNSSTFFTYMLLTRLNPDGSFDEGFGDSGAIINKSGYEFTCVALQHDGKIIAGGHNYAEGAGSLDKFSVSRYTTDGSLDESFGENGTVLTDISDADDFPYAVSILADGKIVAAGKAHYASITADSYMAAVKYNMDGSLDESFGQLGIARVMFKSDLYKSSEATSLVVQQDGKLLIGGSVFKDDNGLHANFALARLKSNGILDSSFGIHGKQITDFGEEEFSNTTVLQSDEKIVLIGNTEPEAGGPLITLTRYNNDEAMPLHFTYFNAAPTNNGVITLNWQTAQEINNNYFSVERSANNNFSEITRINSKGNSSQAQTYSYIDDAPLQGTNFYRLKQVDKDGTFSYSQIVSATIENGLTVVLYPNPVKDVLNIKGLNAGMSYELSVMSAKGSLVAQTSINNTSSYSWNLQSLSKGVYYFIATSNDKKTTLKFVKE